MGTPLQGVAPGHARRRRVILVICDGLGDEWLSASHTPALMALRERSMAATAHRAVFPSVTRVSAASIATGCHPGRHGLEGNQMALFEAGRLTVHNAGAPGFRAAMRRATGQTLKTPTIAQRVASHGGQVAFSNVSPGAAYFLDPEHFGTVFHRSGSFGPAGVPIQGRAHLDVSHDLAGDATMTARFCTEVIAAGDAAVGILWLANPDLTLHHHAPGSQEHLNALHAVDDMVARVAGAVRANGERDDTLLLVGSDHGHETIGASVHIGDWLARQGLESALREGRVAVASQGTAALLYATAGASAQLKAVLPRMQAQAWAGSIATGAQLQSLGLSVDSHGGAALVAALDMARSESVNPHGVKGVRWMVEDGEATPEIGCGQHGGLGPQETRPFLMLSHAAIGVGQITQLTSLVDIAPTLLEFLGLKNDGMDGVPMLAFAEDPSLTA